MAASIQQPLFMYDTADPEDSFSDDDDGLPFLHDSSEAEEEEGEPSLSAPFLSRETPEVVRHSSNVKQEYLYEINGTVVDADAPGGGGGSNRKSGTQYYERLKPLSEPHRFWQLCVGALCCIGVSTVYAFNLYSGQLQAKYNFSQNQMTTISLISDIVGVLTLLFGALYDYYGAKPVFFTAMIFYPLGALLFGLTYADFIQGSVPIFGIYGCMQALGVSLLDFGSVMTLLSIFPVNRGAVVAVMKTFSGMGSAIFGAIHLAYFSKNDQNDTTLFFYFLSSLTLVISFLGFLFVEVPPYMIKGCEERVLNDNDRKARRRLRKLYLRQKAPLSRFAIGFIIVVSLTLFLPVQGVLSAYIDLGHSYHVAFVFITLGFLAIYPTMALPFKILDRSLPLFNTEIITADSRRESRISRTSRRITRVSRMTRDSMSSSAIGADLDYIAPQFQTTLGENLKTFRFWALLWTLFCLIGAQIIIIGNMRFVFGAVAEKPLDESFMALLVVVTGVGSGVGRIFLSVLEMITQGKSPENRIPITFTLLVPTTLVVITLALILMLPSKALPIPCFTMALANGSAAAAVVIVLRTIYAKDVAKHYNFLSFSGIAASVLMNRFLYGEWYTYQAQKQGSTVCYGKQCVLMPILVCLGMNISALFSSCLIHWDYSRFCTKMLEMRSQQQKNGGVQTNYNSIGEITDDSIEAKTTTTARSS